MVGIKVIEMIIDTKSKEGIENSLSEYLDISKVELYGYIDYASKMAHQKELMFDEVIFENKIADIFFDLHPDEKIEELYTYHLSRRLCQDNSFLNLKALLLEDSPVSNFLRNFDITFKEFDSHPILFYKNIEVDLSKDLSTEACYLKKRLGYFNEDDYCYNGFAFRDLLMRNYYASELNSCPEIINILSKYLGNKNLIREYYNNSQYYCFTYKLKISDLIFDGREGLNNEEKIDYFLTLSCLRLLYYMENKRNLFDDDNPIVRLADNFNISASEFVSKEVITLDMLKY